MLTPLPRVAIRLPASPFGSGELPEILKPYDLNNDGKLSAEEHQAYLKAMKEAREKQQADFLKKYDTDGDGKLSAAELQAARKEAKDKVLELRAKRFDELDKDADGFLSAEEFTPPVKMPAAQVAALFNHLDANKDKKISKDEFVNGISLPCMGLPTAPKTPPANPPGGGGK